MFFFFSGIFCWGSLRCLRHMTYDIKNDEDRSDPKGFES